jgi:hypothetical protein
MPSQFLLLFTFVMTFLTASFQNGAPIQPRQFSHLSSSVDTFPIDSLPDSCYSDVRQIVDQDGMQCILFEQECKDTCLCLYIEFTDGSSVSQNIQVPGGDMLKICFKKEIRTWSTLGVECSKCGIMKSANERNVAPGASTKVLLYPNPAYTTLTIGNLSDFTNLRLVMTDVSGRRVLDSRILSSSVDISKVSGGVFIAELYQGPKKILTQKIVK